MYFPFSFCMDGEKDPLSSRRRFIQSFLKNPSMQAKNKRRVSGAVFQGLLTVPTNMGTEPVVMANTKGLSKIKSMISSGGRAAPAPKSRIM